MERYWRHSLPFEQHNKLFETVTVSEAIKLWGRTRGAFLNRMESGAIRWRKSGTIVLMLTEDIVRIYGMPLFMPKESNEYYTARFIRSNMEL